MHIFKALSFTAVFFLTINTSAQKITAQDYIETYKQLAINEMHRTGIPASITLSQGILESGSGNSRLATEGKNHFGIKCHTWTGATIYEDDDLEQECFRKYDKVEDSYIDHSEFLMGRYRYQFLFDLERTDYKGWAHGLKKAGYATNPRYAYALIDLIERYNLHQYDFEEAKQDFIVDNEKDEQAPEVYHKEIFHINRIKTVHLQGGETLADVAERYDSRLKRLERWNDMEYSTGLTAGMNIFLQPKRRKADIPYHIVQEGETLFDISQRYGIKMKMLYRRNNLKEGEEPAVGEKLYMRRNRKDKVNVRGKNNPVKKEENKEKKVQPVVQSTKETVEDIKGDIADNYREMKEDIKAPKKEDTEKAEVQEDSEEAIKDNSQPGSAEKSSETVIDVEDSADPKYIFSPVGEDSGSLDVETIPENEFSTDHLIEGAVQTTSFSYYEVQEGDTLYSISRRFNASVEEIQQWNKMEGHNVKIGERIIVSINK